MPLDHRIQGITGYGFEAADLSNLRTRIDSLVSGALQRVTASPAPDLFGRHKKVVEPSTDQPMESREVRTARIELPATLEWKAQQSHFINNCQLISITSALAMVDPRAIRAMVKEVSQSYMSTLPGKRNLPAMGEKMARVRFHGTGPILVTPRLDYLDSSFQSLRFASVSGRPPEALWMPLIEKAYVALRGGDTYEGLDFNSPGAPDAVRNCFDLWGPLDLIQDKSGRADGVGAKLYLKETDGSGNPQEEVEYEPKFLSEMLKLAKKKPTVATTPSFPGESDPLTDRFTGLHTYVITGYGSNTVRLWEPMHQSTPTLARKDFWKVFDMILQRSR